MSALRLPTHSAPPHTHRWRLHTTPKHDSLRTRIRVPAYTHGTNTWHHDTRTTPRTPKRGITALTHDSPHTNTQHTALTYDSHFNTIGKRNRLKYRVQLKKCTKISPIEKFSLVFKFTSASVFLPYRAEFSVCTCSCTVGKNQVSFSMTIGNEELMHECFPKHLRMGTARMK